MYIRGREQTTAQRPAAAPMNLDTGKLNYRHAVQGYATTLLSLVVALIGSWVAGQGGGVVIIFGGCVTILSVAFGGYVFAMTIGEWRDYRARLADWHQASLDAWDASHGVERIEHTSDWELSTDRLAHVLLAALWAHHQAMTGQVGHSVRGLSGGLWMPYGDGNSTARVGELSSLGAEQMSRTLADLGLVDGRRERAAGRWIPKTHDEVIEKVLIGWNG